MSALEVFTLILNFNIFGTIGTSPTSNLTLYTHFGCILIFMEILPDNFLFISLPSLFVASSR